MVDFNYEKLIMLSERHIDEVHTPKVKSPRNFKKYNFNLTQS